MSFDCDRASGIDAQPGATSIIAMLVAATIVSGCIDLGVPDWSPDGRKIVYTRVSGMRPEVRLLDVDAGEKPLLLAEGAFRARWAPDGERVFFLVAGADGKKGLHSCLPDASDARVHVPLGAASVSWYAPAPRGGSVIYLNETDGVVYRLNLAAGRAERVLPAGVKCEAAALGPSGRYLACIVPLKKDKDEAEARSFEARVFDLEEVEGLPRKAPLAAGAGDDAGVVFGILFTPDESEVVCFVDPTNEIVSMPLGRGRIRKAKVAPGGASLVLKSISPDGRALHLTFALDQDRFTSHKVDLTTGKGRVLIDKSPVLVGGPSWAPGGGAVAEHTPMGIRVSLPGGRWKKHYPVSIDEHVRLGQDLIARGDPAMALTFAKNALKDAGPDADVQRLRLLESDAHDALGDVEAAARSLYEAWLLHPVSDTPPAEVARRAAALRNADRLVDVVWRALKGDARARLETLKTALPLVAEPALVAGANFRIGEAALEAGEAREAGKRFLLASEATDYPAADYAAGLAGVAYYVSGRDDRYAVELLMRAVDLFPTSPLQDDFREALRQARDPALSVLRRTKDANHESGLVAWGSVRTERSAGWSLRPTLEGGRRILVEVSYDSTLYIAGPEEHERARAVLRGVRADLRSLSFAPSGRHLAFVVAGALGQAAYVIDLAGKVVSGDRAALSTGEFPSGETVESLRWAPNGKTLLVTVSMPDGATKRRRVELPKAKPRPRPAPRPAPK